MDIKFIAVISALAGTIWLAMNFFSHGSWFMNDIPDVQLYQWRCLIADMIIGIYVMLISIFIILFVIAIQLERRS